MAPFDPGKTQRLTRASFELSSGWRLRDPAIVLAVVVCLLVVGAVTVELLRERLAAPAALARLEQDHAQARDALQAARVELEVERATHAELQRHVVELQEQVVDLSQRLEFLTSRTASSGGAR